MSIASTPDITIISLVLSATALGIVIIVVVYFSQVLRRLRLINNNLDASALVGEFGQRLRHLEQRIIDEKVRLEILELRLSKQQQQGGKRSPVSVREPQQSPSSVAIPQRLETKEEFGVLAGGEEPKFVNDSSSESPLAVATGKRKDALVSEILGCVAEGEGKVTARQIQQRIGRSREHTARMMNLLYRQGLVSRDVDVRPFTYSITMAGERELRAG